MSAPRDVPPSFWEYLRKGNYALSGSAPSAHVHPLAELLGFGAAGGYVRSSGTAWARVSGVAYADLTGVPSTFAPSAHTHPLSELTGFGTGVATALGVNVGSAGAFVVLGGALGTPSSGSAANLTSFPTLNQSTTGNAATATALATARTIGGTSFDGTANIAVGLAATATILATARAIYGNNFDGSAALTQIIASTFGGTGNGFTRFSGPTTAERVKTLRDVTDTILELGGSYTPTGIWTSLTLVTPALGTPASGTVTNLTGTASININGTVGATTPGTGAFTTLGASTNTAALTAGAAGTVVSVGGADSTNARVILDAFGGVAIYDGRRANGTAAAKTAVVSNNLLVAYTGGGYQATLYRVATSIIGFYATENWTDTAAGTEARIEVTPNGSLARVAPAVFSSTGLAVTGTGSFTGVTSVTATTASTSTTTGAVVVSGGLGVAGNIFSGGSGNFVDDIYSRSGAVTGRFFANSGVATVFLESFTNHPLHVRVNQSLIAAFASTGLAVTGTGTATSGITAGSGTAITAGGSLLGQMISSTASFGTFVGSGAPTISAAKGSLYLRSDGSSTSTRAYINTDGATAWTAITTAA